MLLFESIRHNSSQIDYCSNCLYYPLRNYEYTYTKLRSHLDTDGGEAAATEWRIGIRSIGMASLVAAVAI